MDAAIKIGEQIHSLQLTTVGPELARLLHRDEPDLRPRNGPRICRMLPGGSEERYDRYEKVGQAADFDPISGRGDTQCACASACFFVWAAGSERRGDVIAIHRPYFNPAAFARLDGSAARTAYQRLADDARSYLSKVGIPAPIIDRMLSTDSASSSYLSVGELKQLAMAPHWAEMKLARCGPEPRREVMTEQQARTEELAEMLQGRAPSPRFAHMPWPVRKHLIAVAQREICWLDAQVELRAGAITQYLNETPR